MPHQLTAQAIAAICKRLEAGERIVVGDAFLDWIITSGNPIALQVRTVLNPSRVGMLDRYEAFITPKET